MFEAKYRKPRSQGSFLRNLFFVVVLVSVLSGTSFGSENVPASSENAVDSTAENSSWTSVFSWPFEHILQPALNALVYPVAAPLRYAFNNGIVEKSIDMITFGKERNIMIYPTMNLKPGDRTLLGFTYRHRHLLFRRDYLVLNAAFFANSDVNYTVRYTMQNVFSLPIMLGFRFHHELNRNDYFVLPESRESFTQADSSLFLEGVLSYPLNPAKTWNFAVSGTFKYQDESLPDVKDSVLIDPIFPVEHRGLYQRFYQFPIGATLLYDNLDFPFAPSRGTRFSVNARYFYVTKYEGVDLSGVAAGDDLGVVSDGGKNHDYIRTEVFLQHYFLLGKHDKYLFTKKEARKNRKFYTDFSWSETARIWRPENVLSTLFDRRVLALQFRMMNMWEQEEGGAPFCAYPTITSRFPLRGFDYVWAAKHVMGFSAEYRWPIDYFVDGVLFNEYALYSNRLNDWSPDRSLNSWGFGVRVRTPDLFLFRVQVGFHGLHGVSLVMTIAPEFQ